MTREQRAVLPGLRPPAPVRYECDCGRKLTSNYAAKAHSQLCEGTLKGVAS